MKRNKQYNQWRQVFPFTFNKINKVKLNGAGPHYSAPFTNSILSG